MDENSNRQRGSLCTKSRRLFFYCFAGHWRHDSTGIAAKVRQSLEYFMPTVVQNTYSEWVKEENPVQLFADQWKLKKRAWLSIRKRSEQQGRRISPIRRAKKCWKGPNSLLNKRLGSTQRIPFMARLQILSLHESRCQSFRTDEQRTLTALPIGDGLPTTPPTSFPKRIAMCFLHLRKFEFGNLLSKTCSKWP